MLSYQPIKEPQKRAPNFTEREKAVFTDIMYNYKDIIENKKTDNINVKQKKLAWEKLKEEFNCQVGISQRETSNLKNLWITLKRNSILKCMNFMI